MHQDRFSFIDDEERSGPNEIHTHSMKLYIINCNSWDAKRMNYLSVSLLLVCSMLDCIMTLIVNYLCVNYEGMENIVSLLFCSMIVLLTIPLLIDVSYILVQRVHPRAVSSLMQHEFKIFNRRYMDKMKNTVKWQLWSLDKSYRVCSVKVSMDDKFKDNEQLRAQMREELHSRI